jgi:hypothetical protein
VTDNGGSTINFVFGGRNSSGTDTITQNSVTFTLVEGAPNAEISRVNLSGGIENIQDDPLAPDTAFLTGPAVN